MSPSDYRTIGILLAILATVGVLTWWFIIGDKTPTEPSSRDRVFATSTNFTSATGEAISVTTEPGTYLVVHSWATWCPACHESLSAYGKIAEEFSEYPVRFLAINRKETQRQTAALVDSLNVSSDVEILLDPADHYFTESSGYTVPETIIFSTDGSILYHERGTFRSDNLRAAIRASGAISSGQDL